MGVTALVNAASFNACMTVRTRNFITAATSRWIRTRSRFDSQAPDEGIPKESFFASAIITAEGVKTHCITSAGVSAALIDVMTLDVRITGESWRTDTLNRVGSSMTIGVFSTNRISTL